MNWSNGSTGLREANDNDNDSENNDNNIDTDNTIFKGRIGTVWRRDAVTSSNNLVQ